MASRVTSRSHRCATPSNPKRSSIGIAGQRHSTPLKKQEIAMLPSLIRNASCAATLALVGLLASDASATDVQFKNGHLKIKFDQHVPETVIAETIAPTVIAVVNGGGLVGFYTGVTNISVKGSPLADLFSGNVLISGNFTIKSGAGDDDIYLSGIVSKNVKVSLGTGNDTLQGTGSQLLVGGSYTAKGGAGDDGFIFEDAMLVSGSMSLDLGKGDPAGNQDVGIFDDGKIIQKTLSIKLSKQGDQDVILQNLTADKVIVRGGKGDNTLDLTPGGNVIGKTTTKKVEATLLP
jgi:hypothetical protein